MGDLSIDLQHIYSVRLKDQAHPRMSKLALWLLDSDLLCVACYRYGQYVDGVRRRNRFWGTALVASHRVWNRWVTHIDHADISPRARIGPGLLVMHRHGLVVGQAQIGSNCVLHHNVTIGQRVAGGDHGVPRIGNNVWIGPGATITGGVSIGDNATISAGAVLSKDVPAWALVCGNPARVVSPDYNNGAIMHFHVPEPVAQSTPARASRSTGD